jgi:uncharacterized protein
MERHFRTIVFMAGWAFSVVALGQSADSLFTKAIAVTGRPYRDSIALRWAPLDVRHWIQANKQGYVIERFVMARNGVVLTKPEKSILTESPLRPLAEGEWEPLVSKEKYAAIAAQALFGERFEVDMGNSDVFTIVNKVRENEQRFSFALFSSDMSPAVARASALWFTDKKTLKGEKYLYRIVVKGQETLIGSLFISCDDQYLLPEPRNLVATFKSEAVSLKWESNALRKYTAYIVEKSMDGKTFYSISAEPIVTVSPTAGTDSKYEYAVDTLTDLSIRHYYRVKGVTPFGEVSMPSDIVTVTATAEFSEVPYINNSDNIGERSIRISWDFPEKNNTLIKGFTVERSAKPSGPYIPLTLQSPLPPTTRTYDDKAPNRVNYYRVTALTLDGQRFSSPLYLATLVDSIPPVQPTGLKATIDQNGSVQLTWSPNSDPDVFGYRVYRANMEGEEFAQITIEPVSASSFSDRVSLNTLSESIYYRIMAIDKNQNHSILSDRLKVILPDKVNPQPPVFLPVRSTEKGAVLSWVRSSSDDVAQYDVYRKIPNKQEWQRLKMIATSLDSIYRYTDEQAEQMNSYTVIAVDESGHESAPAVPVTGGKIDNALQPEVKWNSAEINNELKQVVLSWTYDEKNVKAFRIYKAAGVDSATMFRTVASGARELMDRLSPGVVYRYRILAIFENGSTSILSSDIVVNF